MLRKILLVLIILILLAAGALFALLATNSGIIVDKFNDYVTESTGAPLITRTPPEITLFPNRGLEIGAGTWEKPDGTLSISFSRASVQISSHALFTGHFRIKNFSVDDLSVTLRAKNSLWQNLNTLKNTVGFQPPDEIVRLILRTLQIAPDNITVNRGHIHLIQPDNSSITLYPFSLKATNVHPGSDTNFSLQTQVSGTDPDFRASVDLRCTALFTERKASFTIAQAQITPEEGIAFHEHLSLAGGLEYDFASSGLTLSQLHFQGPDLSVMASGNIASLGKMYQDSRQADASLKLKITGDPQRVAEILNNPLPFADHECFSHFELGTEMRWVNNRLHMNNIQGKADDLTFSGRLAIALANFNVSGELKFGNILLDSYQGNAVSRPAANSNLAERDFRLWPKLDLQLSADQITWKTFSLHNVRARMTGQNGTYELNPLSGILLGSPVTASLSARLLPSSPLSALMSVYVSLPQTNLADLCSLTLGTPIISGTGALNASFSFNSYRGLSSLNGKGSLTASKAQTSFSLLPANIPFAESLTSSEDVNQLFCSFDLRNGIMSLNTFSMDASQISLNCSGNITLEDKNIDVSGLLRVAGNTAFPIRIEGDLTAPRYTVDLPGHQRSGRQFSLDLNLDLPQHLDKLINNP